MSALRQPEPDATPPTRLAAVSELIEVLDLEESRLAEVAEQSSEIVVQAEGFVVESDADDREAMKVMSSVKAELKALEDGRLFLTGPLVKHKKAIDERFKEAKEPLERARALLEQKVLAYRREAARRAAEEQARIDREREARDAAERARLERIAADAQAAADAAEKERLEAAAAAVRAEEDRKAQLAQKGAELARRATAAPESALQAAAQRQDTFGQVARDELASRRRTREAKEREAAAEAAAADARAAEKAARAQPAPVLPTARVATPVRVGEDKKWVATPIEGQEHLVPDRFKRIHMPWVNDAVRNGERDIPGMLIEQVDTIDSRAL